MLDPPVAKAPVVIAKPMTSQAEDKETDDTPAAARTDANRNRVLEAIASDLASMQYGAAVGSVIEQLPTPDAGQPGQPRD
jgi:hypothetical protein